MRVNKKERLTSMKNTFYLLIFEWHYRTLIVIIGEPHFY